MSEATIRVLVSQDRGETWRPLPAGWRQSGTILEANESIVRQEAGGGREAWYRLEGEKTATETSALTSLVASMSRADRDELDAILERAQITPEDPRYPGIAVSLHLAAMLASRIDDQRAR